jgi:hypothetical protein
MDFLRRPIWRVPLVLGALGLVCRCLTYVLGLTWGLIQRARGPGPDGSIVLTTGYLSVIMAVISFLLFWWAGWRFLRGMTRRELFWSASIMVVVYAVLLAAEQISQHVFGTYSLTVYRLYALADGNRWVDQLFFRLTGQVSVSTVLPGIFAPYLYLIFGRKDQD